MSLFVCLFVFKVCGCLPLCVDHLVVGLTVWDVPGVLKNNTELQSGWQPLEGGVLGVLGGLWQRAGAVMGNSGQCRGFLSLQLVNKWEMLEKHCRSKWYLFRWYWDGNTSVSQSQWKSSLWIYNGFCPIAVAQVWRWRTQTQSWIRAVEEPKRVLKMEFQCSSHDQASQSWKLPQCPPLYCCFWRRAACAPQPLQKSHIFSIIPSSDLERL